MMILFLKKTKSMKLFQLPQKSRGRGKQLVRKRKFWRASLMLWKVNTQSHCQTMMMTISLGKWSRRTRRTRKKLQVVDQKKSWNSRSSSCLLMQSLEPVHANRMTWPGQFANAASTCVSPQTRMPSSSEDSNAYTTIGSPNTGLTN